jgi:MEMO1 family protein
VSEAPRPTVRPFLEAIPVELNGGPEDPGDDGPDTLLLRDPFRLCQAIVRRPTLALISLMDGTRTLLEVRDEFAARYGAAVPLEQLEALHDQLLEGAILEGSPFLAAVEEFRRAEVRESACIGSYPGDADELRAFLEAQYVRDGGPGEPPNRDGGAGAPARLIRGIVSPHIDMHRGGHSYAHVWRAVAERCTADLFVVFGTSHRGTAPIVDASGATPSIEALTRGPRFAVTRKTFQTPLGDVPVATDVLDRLLAAYDGPDDLLAGEVHHKGEHSIEFQTVYLAHLFGAARPVRVLPVLCGGLTDVEDPASCEALTSFHRALREALRETPPDRVAFVAGIDLAHVGTQFDAPPVGAEEVAQVEREDRETLRLALEQRSATAVHDDIRRGGDPRNICGHAPLVALLQALEHEDLEGQLLHYDAWHDGQSAVSFAAAVLQSPGSDE